MIWWDSKVGILGSLGPDAHIPKTLDEGDGRSIELFEDLDIGKRLDRNPPGKVPGGQVDLSVAEESADCVLRALRLQSSKFQKPRVHTPGWAFHVCTRTA